MMITIPLPSCGTYCPPRKEKRLQRRACMQSPQHPCFVFEVRTVKKWKWGSEGESQKAYPTPRIALFVGWLVRPWQNFSRIVYSLCIYDATIITNVRCGQDDDDDHHHDDYHHHLCTMRSSSLWRSSSFVYDVIIIMMTIIIICVRCDHHHDDNHHHLCMMRS